MPPFELLVAFVLATAVFAYMPGPAMLYAAAQTIARGRRAGWLAALGLHVGGYAHVTAATFGLALLFEAVPVLYFALKVAGAAYLIWLGLRLWLVPDTSTASNLQLADMAPRRAFWQSVTVEVLNPKTAVFFVAFLPQFTDPAAAWPIWLQLLVLGTIVNIMFSTADILCVVLADKMTSFLQRSAAAGRAARRIGGSILIVLGLKVAFSRQ